MARGFKAALKGSVAFGLMLMVSACGSQPGSLQPNMTKIEALKNDDLLKQDFDVLVPFDPVEKGIKQSSLAYGVAKALNTSPAALQTMLGVEASRRAIDQTEAGLGPRIDLEGKSGVTDGSGVYDHTKATYGAGFTFGTTLFDFGQTTARTDRDMNKLFGSMQGVNEMGEVVADSIAQAYDDVNRQRLAVKAARKSLGNIKRFRAAVVAQAEAGTSSTADVRKSDARIERAKSRLSDLERTLADAEDRLQRLTGIKPGTELDPAILVSQPATKPEALAMSKDHPTVQIGRANLQAAIANVIAIKREAFGSIGIEAGPIGWAKALSSGVDPLSIGAAVLKIALPIIDGGERDARLMRAVAAVQVAMAQLQDTQERIDLAVNLAFNAKEDARRQTDFANTEARHLAAALKQQKEEFATGQRRASEILDSEDEAVTAELRAITATHSEAYASKRLAASQGRLVKLLGAADFVTTSVTAKKNPWEAIALRDGLMIKIEQPQVAN